MWSNGAAGRAVGVTAIAMSLFAANGRSLPAQQVGPRASADAPAWVFSPGVGVFTVLRFEAERVGAGPNSTAFALGVHPLGLPSIEALLRRQVGVASAAGTTTFVDVAALGFVPGTQFADGSYPGVGVHLTVGRRWLRSADRRLQLRLGVGVYQEVSGAADKETAVVPVIGLDFGRQRSRGRP